MLILHMPKSQDIIVSSTFFRNRTQNIYLQCTIAERKEKHIRLSKKSVLWRPFHKLNTRTFLCIYLTLICRAWTREYYWRFNPIRCDIYKTSLLRFVKPSIEWKFSFTKDPIKFDSINTNIAFSVLKQIWTFSNPFKNIFFVNTRLTSHYLRERRMLKYRNIIPCNASDVYTSLEYIYKMYIPVLCIYIRCIHPWKIKTLLVKYTAETLYGNIHE